MNKKFFQMIFLASLILVGCAQAEPTNETEQPPICQLCEKIVMQELAAKMVVLPLIGWIAQNSFASFYVYKGGSYEPEEEPFTSSVF